jgi:hypothetical protein
MQVAINTFFAADDAKTRRQSVSNIIGETKYIQQISTTLI